MFISRLSWPPTWLLCLLFASPVLSGNRSPTTPYDPFRAIAALAPKPSEEPICCLKPLTPLEPVDDDLFLSFEDWKAKRFSERSGSSGHKSDVPPGPNSSAPIRIPAESSAEDHHVSAAAADAHVSDTTDPSPSGQSAAAAAALATPTTPASPHFRVPLTDRFNYASLDCSARVHTAHGEAKSASSILSSKRDRYMLSPCAAEPQFVVVELCEDIRIDTVQLANFEFFSGVFKEFTVSVAKTYVATDAEGWTVVGTYVGKNVRGVQSFHPPTSIRDFYRYIRIDFHSHYANEYYCPISLLRVYGLTHLEQWKWDTWEEESRARARQDQNAHPIVIHADILSEPEQLTGNTPRLAKQDLATSQDSPAPATPSDELEIDLQESSRLPESVEGSFRHSTDIARSEPSKSAQVLPTSSDSPIIAISSPASPPPSDPVQDIDYSTSRSHMFSSNESSSASSSVSTPSRPVNVSGATVSASRSSSPLVVSTNSSPSVIQASTPPPVVSLPLSPLPASVHTGESIYRTIMNRLSALEANTTLYARYVEEQTSAMREMLRRLSEDVGRLEGIGRAQAQLYQRSVSDFERHRQEMDIEQRALISQVNYLAEEIVLEKRLGIAQLCLLLAVLVFLSVTRGSPGEFHIPRVNSNADSMREWGRRSLRLSGDWVPSRLRRASSGPPTISNGSNTPTALEPRARARAPVPATAPLVPTSHSPVPTPVPGPATTTTPTFRHKRPPLYLTPVHPHAQQQQHQHHRGSRSRGTHARHGAASPTPVFPVQRSSSHHGTPFIGPVPRSARRWARSAHLHEVRRAHHHHHHHHHLHHPRGTEEEEDVFTAAAVTTVATTTPLSKIRSAAPVTAAQAFGSDAANGGRGFSGSRTAAVVRNRRGEADGGGTAGAADTWVDTDTDPYSDDDGLCEVDAD
ncbi:UNC-like C-terminal-domain-containing protein [Lactifluus subvellereus]|nr:UNC-like C-terminal-domain-containing protein [Lactifluus subvellereus]